MASSGTTVAAHAAGNMSFGGNPVSNTEALYLNATLDDLTTEFVPDGHWYRDRFTCPVIPLIDMDVGAAYRSSFDPDQDIVVSDRRLVDILEPDTTLGFRFNECTHFSVLSRK
jgi:hypothetical protein